MKHCVKHDVAFKNAPIKILGVAYKSVVVADYRYHVGIEVGVGEVT